VQASAGNGVFAAAILQVQRSSRTVFTMQAPASEGSWSFSPLYGRIWSDGMTKAVYTTVFTTQLRKILHFLLIALYKR
jgi:hypothetical protein